MARRPILLVLCLSVSVLVIDAGTPAHAQGEQQRRFAVELRLVAGDLRRLEQEKLTPLHTKGLRERIRGALGYIGLLGREAVQESGTPDPRLAGDVSDLRSAFDLDRLDAMHTPLANLLQRYPMDYTGYDDNPNTDATLMATGRNIDTHLCVGCHGRPVENVPNPAPNLFTDSRSMTREEFVARLVGGLRGVPDTGLDNPYSEQAMRGLYAWYRDGGMTGVSKRPLVKR